MGFQIAIDGPSGSGKSTIAKMLARKLKFIYIDTGAMYRAVGLYCINNNIPLDNKNEIINILEDININIKFRNHEQRIFLNNTDVTETIRTQEVANVASSNISVIPEAREKLVNLQQTLADENSVIMDGRDIGTVVLPNADLKIYLDASVEKRAYRRYKELKRLGMKTDRETVKQEVIERDHNDMSRKYSPLKKADDAIYLDTTDMSLSAVEETIMNLVKNKT